jgi:hypothetical protein
MTLLIPSTLPFLLTPLQLSELTLSASDSERLALEAAHQWDVAATSALKVRYAAQITERFGWRWVGPLGAVSVRRVVGLLLRHHLAIGCNYVGLLRMHCIVRVPG